MWVRSLGWEKEMATPLVFLPGKSHGQRSLVGYSPQGCKESDMTDHTHTQRSIENYQNALLLTGTLTPGFSVELCHLGWSQWNGVLFSIDERLNHIMCFAVCHADLEC